MKTTIHRQFAVGDYKYLIEITEYENRYRLVISLDGKKLEGWIRNSPDEALEFGKKYCYLDAGEKYGDTN